MPDPILTDLRALLRVLLTEEEVLNTLVDLGNAQQIALIRSEFDALATVSRVDGQTQKCGHRAIAESGGLHTMVGTGQGTPDPGAFLVGEVLTCQARTVSRPTAGARSCRGRAPAPARGRRPAPGDGRPRRRPDEHAARKAKRRPT